MAGGIQGDLFMGLGSTDVDPLSYSKGVEPGESVVDRDPPEPDERRRALVSAWTERVIHAKEHWKSPFKFIKQDQDFAAGRQWSQSADDDRYVANIALRVVQQKTSFLYAKNPKAVAKRRERIMNTVWDGTQSQLDTIQQAGMMAAQNGAMGGGMGGAPGAPGVGWVLLPCPLPVWLPRPPAASRHGTSGNGTAQSDDGGDDRATDERGDRRWQGPAGRDATRYGR